MFYYVEWIHFSFESVSHFRNLTKPIYLKKKAEIFEEISLEILKLQHSFPKIFIKSHDCGFDL